MNRYIHTPQSTVRFRSTWQTKGSRTPLFSPVTWWDVEKVFFYPNKYWLHRYESVAWTQHLVPSWWDMYITTTPSKWPNTSIKIAQYAILFASTLLSDYVSWKLSANHQFQYYCFRCRILVEVWRDQPGGWTVRETFSDMRRLVVCVSSCMVFVNCLGESYTAYTLAETSGLTFYRLKSQKCTRISLQSTAYEYKSRSS